MNLHFENSDCHIKGLRLAFINGPGKDNKCDTSIICWWQFGLPSPCKGRVLTRTFYKVADPCFRAGVPNSFCAVGHIHIPGFYMGQTMLKKNWSRQDCISLVPKLICLPAQETSWSSFAAHQLRHNLEITTSPGNNLPKSYYVAWEGVDLRIKRHYLSRHHLQSQK